MEEIWKDVYGYEGLYKVSNLGNVMSNHNGRWLLRKQYICKRTGYPKIGLSKNGVSKTFCVHRLVAIAFIDNHGNKDEVDHINTNRTDNNVSNLRWVTKKENLNNPLTKEKIRIAFTGENSPHYGKKRTKVTREKISKALINSPNARGKTGSLSKLSVPVFQYDLDGNYVNSFVGQAEAYRVTGIIQSDISKACNNGTTAGGYFWLKDKYDKIEVKLEKKRIIKNRKIIQYGKDGEFIKEWESAKQINIELGYRAHTIRACCSGQIEISNGYKWSYKNEL